jgi:SHS2 domain-containing protein
VESGRDPQTPEFEILEHPVDIGFRVRGQTLAQLFENAAAALQSIAVEIDDVRVAEQFVLSASGPDAEALLVNWLNEVLFWSDGRGVVFRQFRVQEVEPTHVSGIGWGEARDPGRHRAKLIVKAATYHQLRLERSPEGWLAEVFLDI